jgi:hypothetical protein
VRNRDRYRERDEAVLPPSTLMNCPVIKVASSGARKTIAAAIFPGVPALQQAPVIRTTALRISLSVKSSRAVLAPTVAICTSVLISQAEKMDVRINYSRG